MTLALPRPLLHDLQRLLLALLDEVRHQPPRLLRGGALGRRTMDRLQGALGLGREQGWEPAAAELGTRYLVGLARTAGLIEERDLRLLVVPPVATVFFHGQPADRVRSLLLAWQRLGPAGIPVLERASLPSPLPLGRAADQPPEGEEPPLPEGGPDQGPPGPHPEQLPAGTRQASLAAPGAWHPSTIDPETTALLALKRRLIRMLARLHRSGPTAAATARPLLLGSAERSLPQAATLLMQGLRELLELGVLDETTWDREGVIQLTSAGVFALGAGGRPPFTPPPRGRVLVQPSFNLVVLSNEGDLRLLYEIGRVATADGPPPSYSYRLNARTVARGVREGVTLESLEELLTSHCPHPLPQNVAHTLADWRQAQERLCIHRDVTLVEFDTPAELDEVLGLAQVTPGVRPLGPTLLLVPQRSRSEVIGTLGTNDFVDLDYGARLPPSLEVGPELELQPLPAACNLWVPYLLQHYATTPPDLVRPRLDLPRLTAEVQAGGEAAAERIRNVFDLFFVGGTPPEVELALRSVTGRVGKIQLATAPVLATEEEETLDVLLRVPVVAESLVRRLGPTAALLRPDPSATLRAQLHDLGLTLDDLLPQAPEPLPEPTVHEPAAILLLLREAAAQQAEVVITYDPGARRPLEEVRVRPREVTTRRGRYYLHAQQPGQTEERVFSMTYVAGVRRLRR